MPWILRACRDRITTSMWPMVGICQADNIPSMMIVCHLVCRASFANCVRIYTVSVLELRWKMCPVVVSAFWNSFDTPIQYTLHYAYILPQYTPWNDRSLQTVLLDRNAAWQNNGGKQYSRPCKKDHNTERWRRIN